MITQGSSGNMSSTIQMIPGLRASNAYLFTSETGQISIIDTGMPGNAKKIADFFATGGKDPKTLSYILLTHPDIDHTGSVFELKEKYATNAKVAIHKEDAPRLSGEMKLKEVRGATGVMMGLFSPFMKFHPVSPDIKLEDEQMIGDLLTIHTPGHTLGSVCFYDKKGRALFSGDTVISDKNQRLVYSSSSMSYDLSMTRNSVETKLKNINFDSIYPGHGPPITSGAFEKLRNLLSAKT
jgi:glyoxylase-like metal-dependent hydrolase (beta-lactamase superfamily II)